MPGIGKEQQQREKKETVSIDLHHLASDSVGGTFLNAQSRRRPSLPNLSLLLSYCHSPSSVDTFRVYSSRNFSVTLQE
jgi:hypothetical protein